MTLHHLIPNKLYSCISFVFLEGTTWTALAHIITGVIGAGVLSLAWSTAQLGWIAGPLCMIAFAGVTIISSNLLADCHRHPDPEFGHIRIRSYMQAVKFYLGEKLQSILSHDLTLLYVITCNLLYILELYDMWSQLV